MNEQELWEEIGSLEKAIEENPKENSLKRNLAGLYIKAGNRWQQFNLLTEELSHEFPNDISVLFLRMNGYKIQGKDKEWEELKQKLLNTEPITNTDYLALIEFNKDIKQYDTALQWIQKAEEKKWQSDELFLMKLGILIDKNDFTSVLDFLTIARLKELKDSELYLVRARLLMNTKKQNLPLGEEIEYLLLESLKIDPKNVDTYTLLLETYTTILENADKVVFLFKLAETNEIENLQFYKTCLSSLLELNEVVNTKELYEVLEEYLPDSEKPILHLVLIIHLKLANIGSARYLWKKYLERKSLYDPDFYLTLISIGENVLAEIDMRDIDEAEADTDDFGKQHIIESILYSYDMLMILDPNNAEYSFLKACFC